jgi:hypothetical protein
MRFSLDVMRARKGDCLMLHYGSKDDPHLILIDGGPSNVYKPHLRPRIEQVRKARALDEEASLPVDVLMVSHVDDDHIKGILDLTKELRGQKEEQEPLLLRVASLWHNGFDDLLDTTPEELKAEAGFGAAALAGEIEVGDDVELEAAKVLASIPQGRDLRNDGEFLKWKRNDKFKGKLILATKGAKPVPLDGGLKVSVIGPLQGEVQKLQKEHDKWLRKRKKGSREAALAAFIDESIPNLSSIVVLAEAQDKSMLLTGDARGDKVLKGLQLTGLLAPGNNSTMHVDVLKVPHHGSANNMETVFFERVTADHYVFSGDGEHGNPERETLEMLLKARGEEDDFMIHLTYPIKEIDIERKKDWGKEQAKEKKRKKKNPKVKVRKDWSPAKNGLAAFFDAHPKLAKKVRIVDGGKPHLIDLLDPVKF